MADREKYWAGRDESVYLYSVSLLVRELGRDAQSILDVGSAGGSYIDWFDWIPSRTSLDLSVPYRAANVQSVVADFLDWKKDRDYDILTCLQVLEHIEDAERFAQKLLKSAKIVIVSVPYRWKAGANKSHIHDPVDEQKMAKWFGRKPNFTLRVSEVLREAPRLIQVYERDLLHTWTAISKRKKILGTGHEEFHHRNNDI